VIVSTIMPAGRLPSNASGVPDGEQEWWRRTALSRAIGNPTLRGTVVTGVVSDMQVSAEARVPRIAPGHPAESQSSDGLAHPPRCQ